MTGAQHGATKKCGLTELIIFVAAIVCGTACSICSKNMMELQAVGMTGQVERFNKPLFQTFGMFVGMCFGLVMHWAAVYWKLPFPGYTWTEDEDVDGDDDKAEAGEGKPLVQKKPSISTTSETNSNSTKEIPTLPTWMYFFLAIPSIFDTGATLLCMLGLQYIHVSIYQMLRGSGIIFVALMKQHVLKHHLYNFQWAGVMANVLSVVFVGATAILSSSSDNEETTNDVSGGQALLGVLLIMAGAFVQALQFVFEEKVMTMAIPAPPLLMIGMEGVWGTFLCVAILYPLAYYLPGDDHGSYENFENTWAMIQNSTTIQIWFVVYFFVIFGCTFIESQSISVGCLFCGLSPFSYFFFFVSSSSSPFNLFLSHTTDNLFAALVTFLLNSVWHAILDNFRPITVWSTNLFIFYVVSSGGANLGEPWTQWSFIQLTGMFILFYGTAVYNAPNAGSLKLQGQWWALGLNFSTEYQILEDAALDAEWEAKRVKLKERALSSFYGEMKSPFTSTHTQALYGLAAQHN